MIMIPTPTLFKLSPPVDPFLLFKRIPVPPLPAAYRAVGVRCLRLGPGSALALGEGPLPVQDHGADGGGGQGVYPVLPERALRFHMRCALVVELRA